MPLNDKKTLYVHHHLGLGDHLHCNGLVRYMLKNFECDGVSLFAKHYDLVNYMYRDDDDIEVIEVDGNNERNSVDELYRALSTQEDSFLRLGHGYYRGDVDKNCWEVFYEQVNVPHDARHKYFYFERDLKEEERVFNKMNPENVPFIFMHDDPARGHKIDRSKFLNSNLKVIENDPSENIFHFMKIIEEAEEVHTMESCFKTLIEFYSKTDNMIYHDIRNHPLGQSIKSWKVVSYAKS